MTNIVGDSTSVTSSDGGFVLIDDVGGNLEVTSGNGVGNITVHQIVGKPRFHLQMDLISGSCTITSNDENVRCTEW